MADNGRRNQEVEIIVLDELVDEDYEPTREEQEEYAQWLGMDLEEDSELLWIAALGLKATLPPPWRPCQTRDNDIFYHNFETGESVWDHPCDEYYRKIYFREKRRMQPCLVGVIDVADEDGGLPKVSLTSMGGNKMAMLEAYGPHETMQSLRRRFKKRFKQPLKLVLPDGRPYTKSHAKVRLDEFSKSRSEEDPPTPTALGSSDRLIDSVSSSLAYSTFAIEDSVLRSSVRRRGASVQEDNTEQDERPVRPLDRPVSLPSSAQASHAAAGECRTSAPSGSGMAPSSTWAADFRNREAHSFVDAPSSELGPRFAGCEGKIFIRPPLSSPATFNDVQDD
eukprot:TRINITY_DN24418_c0_g2_i1.p1 TRINITY_DN24418_c0_g2~~TRINITY_DN24418_c0_g2_i1.p1  ORF type:complete len:351 (+),score=55.82 TRINITY_DN24418_c0_g2_i1:44-1054(+)